MPLRDLGERPLLGFGGMTFSVVDEKGRQYLVDVTEEALEQSAPGQEPLSKRFERFRSFYATLASDLHDEGRISPNGKITVRARDVQRSH